MQEPDTDVVTTLEVCVGGEVHRLKQASEERMHELKLS